ncbi:4-hydroxy-3-methylbut-2-en-1-yl diphosphate synthase (flavodoxin) [Candidatus Kinetoplastibacterium sorsogonicusi]|uniref:4-hydroxy-3-methylbut-2-en-1-yl diphosphate synthase (flavodoxin) n=1 Tax=Candidatus Kinetoplastidibacterium kentomonadis TaxID=1576550 RepID=A0A3Q8EX07_9PROT|nr:flavodoxin-dependent (E)-4-hydroxy-3-methylbut-2-enyl-diphosphate synthase [Candidatus Kinetoplastibacterium sorsogonicusi]AWD32494.1 4-hydroxy-3-methylbut-2-en-1-yl diphosphate synthase (flavodoxin) [Candidatus Kinetoplastibacterium sorsogonicusi]
MKNNSLLIKDSILNKNHKSYYVNICWKNNYVKIGKGYPIIIQSMTNTDTADIESTVNQIKDLVDAGSELVRITVNNDKAAKAVHKIRNLLDNNGIFVPLIGDFHFNGHKLLNENPNCAKSLSKYRINPGNVGRYKTKDNNFAQMIKIANLYNKPIRIGVNWGSLDQDILSSIMNENNKLANPLDSTQIMKEAMISSAINSALYAEKLGMKANNIILSCKVSHVNDLISIYQELSKRCNYALHLGLTEAGIGISGIIASTSALSILLNQGIGNTIRVSVTNQPKEKRSLEVLIAKNILQVLNLRYFSPKLISCPGCGRTNGLFFQKLVSDIQLYLEQNSSIWMKKYIGVENMTVAVMGCVVNGPGESKHANIGISLPGNGEFPVAPVYINGIHHTTIKGNDIYHQFINILNQYINKTYKIKM